LSYTFRVFFVCIFLGNIAQAQSKADDDFFQKKRFNAGLVLGFNASELTGEGLDSYIGWNGGVFGIVNLKNNIHLSVEMLYSLNFTKVRFNFIEVPLQINFQLQQSEDLNNRKGWLRAGISFAQLINFKAFIDDEEITEQIIFPKKNTLLVNFGGTFFISRHWGIDVRMSLPVDADDLIPTFAFRGIYLF